MLKVLLIWCNPPLHHQSHMIVDIRTGLPSTTSRTLCSPTYRVLSDLWSTLYLLQNWKSKQERIQSNANHPHAESMGYIKSEGM